MEFVKLLALRIWDPERHYVDELEVGFITRLHATKRYEEKSALSQHPTPQQPWLSSNHLHDEDDYMK